jgi:hypothetical protein
MITPNGRRQSSYSEARPRVDIMRCSSCGSENVNKFKGEIAIRSPGLKNLDKPIVWVFPDVIICADCGTAQFAVPEAELRMLEKGAGAAGGLGT